MFGVVPVPMLSVIQPTVLWTSPVGNPLTTILFLGLICCYCLKISSQLRQPPPLLLHQRLPQLQQLRLQQQHWQLLIVMMAITVVALTIAIVIRTGASVQIVGKLVEIKKLAALIVTIHISHVDQATFQSVGWFSTKQARYIISGMSKCAVDNGKMYDIKLGTCDMPLDESDQFYKTVIISHLRELPSGRVFNREFIFLSVSLPYLR